MRSIFSNFNLISKIIRAIAKITIFAAGVLTSPIIFLVILPSFATVKYVISSAAFLLRPGLRLLRLVPGSSVPFCVDDIWGPGKPRFNAAASFTLKGHIALDQFRSAFQHRIIDKRTKAGKLVYPELQQFWTSSLNYLFWKQDPNFDVRNHIRLYDYNDEAALKLSADFNEPDGSCTSEKDIQRILGDLLSKSWRRDQSPWEILLVPNFRREIMGTSNDDLNNCDCDLLLFRLHHGLGDGYSFLKLIKEFVSPTTTVRFTNNNNYHPPQYSPWENWIFYLTLPIRLPFDFAGFLVDSFDGPNCWHLFHTRMSREYYTSFTQPFPTGLIKKIKNGHGVSYNDVLVSASCGAVRRLMSEMGQKIPSEISAVSPFPVSDHSTEEEGLVNQMSMTCSRLPLGLDMTAVERLHLISDRLKISKFSTVPLAAKLFKDVMGSILPNFLVRVMQEMFMSTMGISCFPGPSEPFDILGVQVDNVLLAAALGMGRIGACLILFSTGGKQRCFAAIDRAIVPSSEIFEKYAVYLEQELNELLLSTTQKLCNIEFRSVGFSIVY